MSGMLAIIMRQLAIACCILGFAATRTNAQGASSAVPGQSYKLGSGDILRIAAFQSPELSLDVQVSEGGQISYPLVGVVEVSGRTPFEVGRLLERRLREGGFFKAPQINVLVADYRSKVVSVTGQVARPGRYPIDRDGMRISEVVAQAGGILPSGANRVTILRGGSPDAQRLIVDMVALFDERGSPNDPMVVADDRIFVDRAPSVFIRGEVQRPGEYPMTRSLTVGQALAVAGGVTPRGNEKNVKAYRVDANGQRRSVDVERGDIVRENDEIVIQERVL